MKETKRVIENPREDPKVQAGPAPQPKLDLEPTPGAFPEDFPDKDSDWTEEHWLRFIAYLVEEDIVSYREVAASILGHLNPPQVGTSLTGSSFQDRYGKGTTWATAREWLYEQSGYCADCGTAIQLQADHVQSRLDLGSEADRYDNLTLRCRRCNVIRRPSHKKGGLTFLTTEAALMWILLTKRPPTYQEFEQLCRAYGLTMANIRFQEAWARARWLAREGEYFISPESKY